MFREAEAGDQTVVAAGWRDPASEHREDRAAAHIGPQTFLRQVQEESQFVYLVRPYMSTSGLIAITYRLLGQGSGIAPPGANP
eukprot:gene23524-biopygen8682